MYYRDACCIIISFSLVDEASFASVPTWIDQIEENTEKGNVLLILIGTKADLV